MRSKQYILSFLTLMFLSTIFLSTNAPAQLWSGILSSGRAVNWANSGIPGGLPDSNWTQCGSTIAPYSGSGSTISNAIASCGANQYVQLAAGTFNLSSGIFFGQKSNVVLRGMGANQTLLNFSGSGAGSFGAVIAMEGSMSDPGSGEQNVCDWTAGYSAGTTTLTLSNCGSTTPSSGNKSNLVPNSTLLVLDQVDDSFDNGTIFNCYQTYTSNPAGLGVCGSEGNGDGNPGFLRTDGTCTSGPTNCHRTQNQTVLVTGVSSCGTNCATVTISPGLYMPNWRNSQRPQAWWSTTAITQEGLENLSINNLPDSGQNPYASTIDIMACYQCWVHGVRSLYGSRSHLNIRTSKNVQVDSNYFFGSFSHQTVSYGIETNNSSDGAIINNILQEVTSDHTTCSGPCSGYVFGYNWGVNIAYSASNPTYDSNYMQAQSTRHSGGTAFNLDEGNITDRREDDNVHGTHHFETDFRNYHRGWTWTCMGGTCSSETSPIVLAAGTRYYNIVGDVLGLSGYHNAYQCLAAPTCHPSNIGDGDTAIYGLQQTGGVGGCTMSQCASVNGFCTNYPACTSFSYYDPQVGNYLMRWANYDTVSGTARFCGNSSDTGWSSTCGGTSEIPSTVTSYPAAIPTVGDTSAGQPPLPPSFYYSSAPAFAVTNYGTMPWPAIGPDVTGGNVSGAGGHANMIAAELVWKGEAIDPSFQHSYAIASSSWSSSNGGLETLTFSGTPWNTSAGCGATGNPCNPVGELRFSSGPLAGNVYQTVQSTGNTVTFALATNPGTVTGTMVYPNVRLFTASDYGAATTSSGPAAPTGLKAVVH